MIFGLLSICALSAFSTWLAGYLQLPIPGAIIGLLALFFFCLKRGKPGASLERASQSLTVLIPLLILPSCIGIMDHWHLIKREWLPILIAITVSVVFTLVTTPWLYAKLCRDEKDELA